MKPNVQKTQVKHRRSLFYEEVCVYVLFSLRWGSESQSERMSSRPVSGKAVSGKACCGNAADLAQVNAIEKTRSLQSLLDPIHNLPIRAR